MTRPSCSRLWQVEAIRDGRLSGQDLEVAQRHREHCTECAREARRLGELTLWMSSSPELPRDALSVRRARQRLLAAVNDSLLSSAPKRARAYAALFALVPLAALGYYFFGRSPPRVATEPRKSAVEVRSISEARWAVQSSAALEQIDLSDGVASFQVYPHPGQRVLVRLPDGELEDRGTRFEIAIHEQHTARIAVSEGRVEVRLEHQAPFSLRAGEQWERPIASAVPVSSRANSTLSSSQAPPRAHSPPSAVLPAKALPAKVLSTAAPQPAPSATLDRDSTRAEDAAYLAVVQLLRRSRYAEARAQAKAYLMRFPNGFRRVEMLDVATGPERDSGSR